MSSLRCAPCQVNWPYDLHAYKACPGCHSRTWWHIDPPDDLSVANHKAFQAFYFRREQQLAAQINEIEVMVELETPLNSD